MPDISALLTGRRALGSATLAACLLGLLAACSSSGEGRAGPTDTGQSCTAAAQCYPGVKEGELVGDALCLDKVEGGYCTHLCTTDQDCCAAAGECAGNHAEVCSPFESADDKYCFLSCEDVNVATTKLTDPEVYCQTYAGTAFHCHSSGGGSENRKVCTP